MRDWKSKLDKWIQAWQDLSELTRDCFPIRRPITVAWKSALPNCPTLTGFYALCDGGTFGSFDVSSVTELNDPSSGSLADSPGLELKPGRGIQFGNHYFGHYLLWDADVDEIVLYSPDGVLLAGACCWLFIDPTRSAVEAQDPHPQPM